MAGPWSRRPQRASAADARDGARCREGHDGVRRHSRVPRRFPMADSEFPAPQSGFVLTHFLVVSDQDRSREFYRSVFGATVVLERDPVILQLANSWLILNVGGGPTDDKPAVTLAPPDDPGRASAFLN